MPFRPIGLGGQGAVGLARQTPRMIFLEKPDRAAIGRRLWTRWEASGGRRRRRTTEPNASETHFEPMTTSGSVGYRLWLR